MSELSYAQRVMTFRALVRLVAGLLGGVALVLFAAGCENDAALSLLSLREVTPRDVEVGERIELRGAGFPRGRTARVLLRGTLYRPAAPPQPGFEARTDGIVTSDGSVEFDYDDRLQALFCGPRDAAMHTTFRGEVTVTFAAAAAGAPPAAASLPDVVLDLRPPPGSPALVERMRSEGERFAEAMGIVLDRSSVAQNGLAVENVREGSGAERGGLLPGDLITGFENVVVRNVADLTPPSGAASALAGAGAGAGLSNRSVALTVRRGADPEERALLLPMADYQARASLSLIGLMALMAVVAALTVFAPIPRGFRWAARRLATDRRGRRRSANAAWSLLPTLAIPLTVATPIVLREIVGSEPELITITLAIIAAAAALHAVAHGGGFGARLGAAASAIMPLLPTLFAVGGAGLLTGATRITEASHVQGAWIWEFLALRGFAPLAMTALALGGLLLSDGGDIPRFGRVGRVAHAGRRAMLYSMGTLLTIALLGGWQSPLASSSHGASIVGALLFMGKSAAIGEGLSSLRRVIPTMSAWRSSLWSIGTALLVVGAAFAAPFEAKWDAIGDSRLVAWGLTAALSVIAMRAAWLIVDGARSSAPKLDPFI